MRVETYFLENKWTPRDSFLIYDFSAGTLPWD